MNYVSDNSKFERQTSINYRVKAMPTFMKGQHEIGSYSSIDSHFGIILISMKRDSSDNSDNLNLPTSQSHQGKYRAKKTGKYVGSTTISAEQYLRDYDKTVEKNRERDWLMSDQREYPNEPVPVKIQPKKEVELPPFWKGDATSNQKKQDSEQQASDKTKNVMSNEKFKDNLLIARKKMNKIVNEEEKVEDKSTVKSSTPPKIQIQPKSSVAQPAPREGHQVDTPATRLANITTKEANINNTEKPVVLNPVNNTSQSSMNSHPFGQTGGFSFNPTVHNRQQSKTFPNAALLAPNNPIANIISPSPANQPVMHFNQLQTQPQYQPQPQPQFQPQPQPQPIFQPQFQVQPKREQKAQSKLYNNPQWLNFRANLYELLKNKSLNDRMLDILTVFTFPDPKYLNKEEIEPIYRQIIDLGNICYDAKEKKKLFLSKQPLGFSPLDKKKVGFGLDDYLESLKEVQPSKDFSKDSVIQRIEKEDMVEEIDQFCQGFQEMTVATFIKMYVGFYCDFRDDLTYLTEKVVKTMQIKHRIDALLAELKEEQEEEQIEGMMNRFDRIREKQESISTILTRITQSLNVDSEELPKSVLNYEIEDLEAIEKEEEHLRDEMTSWRDQLCESQQGQPYKKIVNSFCECSIALVKRVEEIQARLNALSSSA